MTFRGSVTLWNLPPELEDQFEAAWDTGWTTLQIVVFFEGLAEVGTTWKWSFQEEA